MNRVLKYLLFAETFWLLAAGLFGPIYAIFVTNIGGYLFEAGVAYAGFSFAAGTMVFIIGRWEDHVNHKEKLIILGHAIGAGGILGYIFVSNSLDLFIVQIVIGAGGAISSPAFDGIYSKHLDKGKFASEWGMYETINYFVMGISAVAGGTMVSFLGGGVFGFQVLFMIMFILSMISIAASVKLYYINR